METMKLLQFDFPMQGPWGDDLARAMGDLAKSIAEEPGLIWKIWTENAETGEAGGIYLFESDSAADAYRTKHTARLESFGITGIRARKFDVNPSLTAITRGPIGTVGG